MHGVREAKCKHLICNPGDQENIDKVEKLHNFKALDFKARHLCPRERPFQGPQHAYRKSKEDEILGHKFPNLLDLHQERERR